MAGPDAMEGVEQSGASSSVPQPQLDTSGRIKLYRLSELAKIYGRALRVFIFSILNP